MQKTLLFLSLLFLSTGLFAQCDELFISEYVEGYSNNKALEIYNPTSEAINLSEYSVGRFSNGETFAVAPPAQDATLIPLPDVMLAPHDVFVVVVDQQDMSLWNSQFDKPVWNGYNLIDTLFEQLTGLPIIDDDGNVVFGPQYSEMGEALFGTDDYDERYDLQCKADVFLCPTYEINNSMYFNGDDAVVLIKGGEVVNGSEIIDVVGVIGEQPDPAWVNADGFILTEDRSLVRKAEVTSGRNDPSLILQQNGGTFMGEEWLSYPKNSFDFLGIHNSVCNSNPVPDRFSCSLGPITSTGEINQIPFKMFPNPNATGMLTVEAESAIERVVIHNLLGQIVLTDETSQNTEQTQINLTKLDRGMYLVNLHFENDQLSIQKLVVE